MNTAVLVANDRIPVPADFVLLDVDELQRADGGAWIPHTAVTALRVAGVIAGIGGGIAIAAFAVGLAIGYYAYNK